MSLSSEQIASLRLDYSLASLQESDVDANPILQFQVWFQEAMQAAIEDVNAMTLSTSDLHGNAHARTVLLKGVEENHFIFFTNYLSRKGHQIETNPQVSLLFYWKELQRQVIIEGLAEKISEAESTTYFHSRPKDSQIGAWASHQSQVLNNRSELELRFTELKTQYADSEVPKPPHWGGYRVKPSTIEFWQGRSNRLHDRILYSRENDSWIIQRLNP